MENKDQENLSLHFSKKWTYVPGKVYNLPPLDLQSIKKQLQEHSQEEAEDTSDNDEEIEEKTTDLKECGVLEKEDEKEVIVNHNSTEDNLNALRNNVKPKHSSFSSSLDPLLECTEDETVVCNNKENIIPNSEPLNLSKGKKTNDSFDLDFSALSLNTPIKKKETHFNFTTPKINIVPPSETKSSSKAVSQFVTPKVNISKNQYSVNKPLFKTPMDRILGKPQFSARKLQVTPKVTPRIGSFQPMKPVLIQQVKAPDIQDIQRVPMHPMFFQQEDHFDRITVNHTEYIVLNLLGKGGSSEVFHCFSPEDKIDVAIKVVSLTDPTTADGYINEVKLLESLQKCDKIIKMHDYEIQEEQLLVVLEKGGEDLSTILKQLVTRQNHLSTYMLLFYWLEMLYAVKQIHSNGVIHSDLKPANFLRAEGGLKLIDFGIASKVQDDMTSVFKANQEGSCNYMSPEALNVHTNGNVNSPNYGKPKYKIHFKSDVWSLGCILYQLIYRKTPFQHINQIWAKLTAIVDPNHNIQYPPANWLSPKIVNTVKKCLQYNTKSRPSVDELIEEYEQMLRNI